MTLLARPVSVLYITHMGKDLERQYREALRGLNLAQTARDTGRGLRTLHAYMNGDRRVTEAAAGELVDYLRSKSETFMAAADKVEAALEKEG